MYGTYSIHNVVHSMYGTYSIHNVVHSMYGTYSIHNVVHSMYGTYSIHNVIVVTMLACMLNILFHTHMQCQLVACMGHIYQSIHTNTIDSMYGMCIFSIHTIHVDSMYSIEYIFHTCQNRGQHEWCVIPDTP